MGSPKLAKILNYLSAWITASVLLVCSIACTQSGLSPATQKPNILFILTDNQPPSLLGCYGNHEIQTPNIDKLAEEGIRFTNAFAVNGMCSPTRATLYTALLPSQTGVHDWLDDNQLKNWPSNWNSIQEFRTLPLTLNNRGYQTAMIGKYHLGQPRASMPGFDYWLTFTYGHTIDFYHNTVIDNGVEYQVNDRHICDFFTDKAVEYIKNYDGKNPFYLQLNYDGPYLLPPTNYGPDPMNRFYKEYEGKEFESFPRVAISDKILNEIPGPDDPNNSNLHMLYMIMRMHNDPASMANVAAQNTLVDDDIGKVLATLKEKGLDSNTLVIFSTDQADLYGQHGLWGHTIFTTPAHLYDAAMNIPLIFRQPGTIARNIVSDLMIGQYDLMPTILAYAGFGDVKIENSPGKSFSPYLRGQKLQNWNQEVYFEQEESRGIRTPEFSYWKRMKGIGKPELYDMVKDPGQLHNVYEKAEYADIVRKLDGKLITFFDEYAVPKYDLWKCGTAKGSVAKPEIYKQVCGENWTTTTTEQPPFGESLL